MNIDSAHYVSMCRKPLTQNPNQNSKTNLEVRWRNFFVPFSELRLFCLWRVRVCVHAKFSCWCGLGPGSWICKSQRPVKNIFSNTSHFMAKQVSKVAALVCWRFCRSCCSCCLFVVFFFGISGILRDAVFFQRISSQFDFQLIRLFYWNTPS